MQASSVKHTQLRGLQGPTRGFFRMLVFVGYVACLVLVLTGMYIPASESLLTQKRSSRIFAMETFFAASPVAVLACVTAHAVLYSLTVVIAWTYGSHSLLAVALGNLVATCGMLLLPQRTVHFTLATTAAVTRALLHGTVSASVVGFLWYRVVVAVSNCTFVAYAALWALTEVIAVIFMLCHAPLVGTATFNTWDLLGIGCMAGGICGKTHAARSCIQRAVFRVGMYCRGTHVLGLNTARFQPRLARARRRCCADFRAG
jgi:hypothetical protein